MSTKVYNMRHVEKAAAFIATELRTVLDIYDGRLINRSLTIGESRLADVLALTLVLAEATRELGLPEHVEDELAV